MLYDVCRPVARVKWPDCSYHTGLNDPTFMSIFIRRSLEGVMIYTTSPPYSRTMQFFPNCFGLFSVFLFLFQLFSVFFPVVFGVFTHRNKPTQNNSINILLEANRMSWSGKLWAMRAECVTDQKSARCKRIVPELNYQRATTPFPRASRRNTAGNREAQYGRRLASHLIHR